MSDNETVDVEVITPSIEDMLDAIAGGNALDSQKMFADLMSAKVYDALEAEKVRVAGQVFNGETDLEVSEKDLEDAAAELEAEVDDFSMDALISDLDNETEVEEPVAEVEVEEPVAEVEEPVAEIDLGSDEEHEEVEDTLGLYGDEEAEADVEEILSSEE